METGPIQIGPAAHRRVEPTHQSAWPVHQPRPFDEALATANERRRDADRVDFSDELRRLNAEQQLRESRCDGRASDCTDAERSATTVLQTEKIALREETTDIVHRIEHRYEVTHRSTTGRLIDMLM